MSTSSFMEQCYIFLWNNVLWFCIQKVLAKSQEREGSTTRMISCLSPASIIGPSQRQDAVYNDLWSDPVGKIYKLALCLRRHCPINTQTY